jgi:hypothetical protein
MLSSLKPCHRMLAWCVFFRNAMSVFSAADVTAGEGAHSRELKCCGTV